MQHAKKQCNIPQALYRMSSFYLSYILFILIRNTVKHTAIDKKNLNIFH